MDHDPLPPPGGTSRALWRGEAKVTYAVKILLLIVLTGVILSAIVNFIGRIATVGIIVMGAIFFSYLIYPLVRRLNERFSAGVSIAIVYVALAAVLIVGVAVIVPALSTNVKDFVGNAPSMTQNMQAALANSHNPLVQHLPPAARDYIAKLPTTIQGLASRYGADAASKTLAILLSTISLLALFIIIPVVAAYMLLEAEKLTLGVVGMIPLAARPRTIKMIAELDQLIGGFIRGQLIVAASVGTLVTILLLMLHVQYAVLIGVVAGILDVVPYVGAIAGWLPAFVIALFTNGWQNALFVTLGIVAINQLEGNVIAPNVVSKSVELSPLIVVIALITGGELIGIPGLLIAVPVAGIIRVLIMNFRPPLPVTVEDVHDLPLPEDMMTESATAVAEAMA